MPSVIGPEHHDRVVRSTGCFQRSQHASHLAVHEADGSQVGPYQRSPLAELVEQRQARFGQLPMQVPRKLRRVVAIVGFDNIEFAEHAATPLTSVNYEIKLVTDLAIARLLELIAVVGPLPQPAIRLIDPELIVRESTLQLAYRRQLAEK